MKTLKETRLDLQNCLFIKHDLETLAKVTLFIQQTVFTNNESHPESIRKGKHQQQFSKSKQSEVLESSMTSVLGGS